MAKQEVFSQRFKYEASGEADAMQPVVGEKGLRSSISRWTDDGQPQQ
jgi:hypothetical protein